MGAMLIAGRLPFLLLVAMLLASCSTQTSGVATGATLTPTLQVSTPTTTAIPVTTEPATPVPLLTSSPPLQAQTTATPVDATTKEPAAVPATATPATITYEIQPGDTLLGLALARGIELSALLALNPGVRPEALQIGQVITVPANSAVSASSRPSTTGNIELTIDDARLIDTTDGVWILGEVSNQGDEPAAQAELTVTLIGPDGESISTFTAWSAGRRIEAGGRAPFALYLPPPQPDISDFQIAIERVGQAADADPPAIQPQDVVVETRHSTARVTGLAVNTSAEPINELLLTASFYNEAGQFIGYRQIEGPGELEPGAEWPFEFNALPITSTVTTVTIRVDAQRAGN